MHRIVWGIIVTVIAAGAIAGFYGVASVNPHAAPWFVACLCNIFLGIFVFFKNRQSSLNRTYALFVFLMAFWTLGVVGLFLSPDLDFAWHWGRATAPAAIFIPPVFLQFVLALTRRQNDRLQRRILFTAYGLSILFAYLDYRGIFITEYLRTGLKYAPVAGPVYKVWTIELVAWLLYAIGLVYVSFRRSASPAIRNQLKYFLAAIIIATAFMSCNLLISFGVKVYPLGGLANVVYSSIIAYAIVKHQLLDIQVIIRKGIVYATLTALVVGAYAAVVALLTALMGSETALYEGAGINALVGLIIAVLFLPLREKVQLIVDRLFFKEKYDYRMALRNLSSELTSVLELELLLDMLVTRITETMHISRGCVLLREEERGYAARAAKGMNASGLVLTCDDPVVTSLNSRRPVMIIDEETYPDAARFHAQGIQVLVPLITKSRLLGVFCLGGKQSEDAYTIEDRALLTTVANQAAVAIENAQLSSRMRALEKSLHQTDKLAALGTFASSVAHEIKNPLASIKTFCQLAGRRFSEPAFVNKFAAIVPGEIERLEHVLSQLLDFGKRSDLNIEQVRVERIIDDLLVLLQYEAFKNNVKIERRYGEESVPVMAAGEQLKQVFMNMVLNAIQAMPDGGTLTVTTGKTMKDGVEQAVISFRDTGQGIAPEHLERLFKPFFTTKENGTGLGLSIARRIIREHNGTINVESVQGRGTAFTILLPSSL